MLIFSSRSITFDEYWLLSRCFTFCNCFAYDVLAGIFLSRHCAIHSWSIGIMVYPLLFQVEASYVLLLLTFTTCDDCCDRLSISDLVPLISMHENTTWLLRHVLDQLLRFLLSPSCPLSLKSWT